MTSFGVVFLTASQGRVHWPASFATAGEAKRFTLSPAVADELGVTGREIVELTGEPTHTIDGHGWLRAIDGRKADGPGASYYLSGQAARAVDAGAAADEPKPEPEVAASHFVPWPLAILGMAFRAGLWLFIVCIGIAAVYFLFKALWVILIVGVLLLFGKPRYGRSGSH